MSIINLPNDIQNNILSFIYFSNNTINKLKPNLFLIKNYTNVFYNVFINIFKNNIIQLNKFFLRFLLKDEHYKIYNKLNYYNVILDYEKYSKNQIKIILNHLNVLEINKIYTYYVNM
jgi:hypothetical protein